jgi:uncharacterized protein (TIGR02996 family)
MAIVSKAVFEKDAGKNPTVGTRLGMDRYVTTNKALDPLAQGGRLYLVTVRPPNEDLWLVAVLDRPKHDGTAWVAKKCTTPITDISKLRSKIQFTSGTGITAKKGALGMSLQTPRALTPADTALLDAAAAAAGPGAGSNAGASSGTGAATAGAPAGASAGAAPADDGGGALLETILADPDNDDPRRIYADLLSQRGDPRGEFIQIELALDGPLSIRRREALSKRRAELFKAHAKQWFPYSLASSRTHHGFLHAVTGTFKQLKTASSKLFAAEPVTEVELSDLDEETASALLAAKWLPRVRRLILRGEIGDEGFTALCGSASTAGLRSLNVTRNELGADALTGLGDGLPRCTSLVLTGNPFGDDGIEGLRRWKHLGGIEALYLSRCELSGEAVGELLGTGAFAHLDKLCLADNDDLGDDAAKAIAAAAARLPKLRHIDLDNTGLSTKSLRALAAAKLPALRRIDARGNGLDDNAAPGDRRVRV